MVPQEAQGGSGFVQQDENRRLKRAVEELSILNDLARAIGGSVNLQDIIRTIIQRSLRAIHAEQGVITLVDRQAGDTMKTFVRTAASSSEHPQFHLTQSLLGWMHLNKKPLMVNHPKTDERFRGVQWDDSIQSLLCVPMTVKGALIGVLAVYNKREEQEFTEEDQRLLAIIAGQSAQVVENARLYEEELAFRRMQEELRVAAAIQLDLLPKAPPAVQGYDIAGRSIPAQLVGGDYFDFIPMGDNQLAICLADVSGKGLPASLLMANVQATLRGQTLRSSKPSACVQWANKLLFQSTGADKFITLFYAHLDCQTNVLSYCNAGQEHPFHFSGEGKPTRLGKGGIVLSVLEVFPYEEAYVHLLSGDLIVVYSDGVSEAVNAEQEQFGEGRILRILVESRTLSAEQTIDAIVGAVRKHAGAVPQADDITIVVIKRL
jgi:sigma-B regulation protein RsbU (phosphoserine phosphatase)